MAAEAAEPVARNPDVSIPSTGTGTVIAGDPLSSHVSVRLPAAEKVGQRGSTRLFDGSEPATTVAVQTTEQGLRALVHLESADAPERYPFTLGGDVVRMQQNPDGSVSAYDADDRRVTRIAPSWARDAEGRDVPTSYEIYGTTLVLVVKHHGGNWAYGITADPFLDDIIDLGKSLFQRVKDVAKRFAVPVCVAKGVVDTVNDVQDLDRVPLPGTEKGDRLVRKILLRNLAGCVPEVGQYVQIVYDLLFGEEP